MKASEALQKPGDVARRESDKAVALCTIDDDTAAIYLFYANGDYVWVPVKELTGDDWQPLHPAGDGEAESKREALAYAAGYESCQREHAAEVERLTAELATATQTAGQELEWRVQAQLFGDKLQAEVDSLTARVAELESGIKRVQHYATGGCDMPANTRLRVIARECEGSLSPLPTAGEEAKAEKISAGNAGKSMSEHRAGGCLTTEDAVAAIAAQAEPDRPAEEREELRAEVETLKRLCGEVVGVHTIGSYCKDVRSNKFGEVAEKIMQHFDRGNQEEHRKPACLDGVPAVLCEYKLFGGDSYETWAFDRVVNGFVRAIDVGGCDPEEWHISQLTPIHHDPTDAAAVELAGRIAEGGKDG